MLFCTKILGFYSITIWDKLFCVGDGTKVLGSSFGVVYEHVSGSSLVVYLIGCFYEGAIWYFCAIVADDDTRSASKDIFYFLLRKLTFLQSEIQQFVLGVDFALEPESGDICEQCLVWVLYCKICCWVKIQYELRKIIHNL